MNINIIIMNKIALVYVYAYIIHQGMLEIIDFTSR